MKVHLGGLLAIALTSCATIDQPQINPTASSVPLAQEDPETIHTITDPAVMDAWLESLITDDRVAGYSVLVYQNGGEAYYGAAGYADRETQQPLQRDTIHSIFSMTKPVIGVALMTLYEQDKFELDDPIAKYIPEFADAQVYQGTDADGNAILVPPTRPITVLDMLRHTSGLAQSMWDGDETLKGIYQSLPQLDLSNTLTELAEVAGSAPLLYQPGTRWRYSNAVDIQALMIERLSGQPVDQFLQESILGPLGMVDTGYYVPEGKQHRLASIYSMNDEDRLESNTADFVHKLHRKQHTQKLGSYGLASTLDDYARFARMLLNGGELDGVRVLKPATVALMADDHLPSDLEDTHFLLDGGPQGFGIDFAVRLAPPGHDWELYGHVGEYNWSGAAGTNFWVDPENDLVAVLMTQRLPFEGAIHKEARDAVYNVMYRSAPPAPAPQQLLDPELSQWDTWMGIPHSSVAGLPEGTFQSDDVTTGTPMGLNNDPLNVFTTFEEDGETILHVSGEIYGGLTSKVSFENYHLQLQVKWGDKKWPPRLEQRRDSGLLYHCQGDHGAFWQVWKACLEYQIQEHDFGDFIPLAGVKGSFRGHPEDDTENSRIIFDPSADYLLDQQGYRHATREPDYAHGEWNTVDLYVVGDRAIHVVNGEVVFAIKDALGVDDKPLTSGQIQLQSEAAEIFYKNVTIRPIDSLPEAFVQEARLD